MRLTDPRYEVERVVDGTPLRGSCGMAFDPDGNVLVGHVFSGRISRIDRTTGEISTFVDPSRGLLAADDITTDGRGTYWTSCTSGLAGESVFRIDADGAVRAIYSGIAGANGIQYNRRNGRLFVGQFGAGNGLFEIDPAGATPPRLITNAFASTNAFDFDLDDKLLVTVAGGRIARVDPDTGRSSLLEVQFPHNSALKVGPSGEIYVSGYENGRGMLWRVAPDGRSMQTLSAGTLPPLDNLLYSPDGRLYVSSLRDATVIELDVDAGCRELRRFSPPGPATILSMAAHGDRLIVNDGLSLRELDAAARTLRMTKGSFYERRGFPIPGCLCFGDDGTLLMAGGLQSSMSNVSDGRVYAIDPTDFSTTRLNAGTYAALHAPSALCASPEALYVAEFLSGRLLSLDRGGDDTKRRTITDSLAGPLGLACRGDALYVAESLGQRISAIDLRSARRTVLVSDGLGRPTALAVGDDGALLTIDSANRRLLRIDPSTGAIAVIAEELPVYPIVLSNWPLLCAMNGLAVDGSGRICVGCNGDGSVWRLARRH